MKLQLVDVRRLSDLAQAQNGPRDASEPHQVHPTNKFRGHRSAAGTMSKASCQEKQHRRGCIFRYAGSAYPNKGKHKHMP